MALWLSRQIQVVPSVEQLVTNGMRILQASNATKEHIRPVAKKAWKHQQPHNDTHAMRTSRTMPPRNPGGCSNSISDNGGILWNALSCLTYDSKSHLHANVASCTSAHLQHCSFFSTVAHTNDELQKFLKMIQPCNVPQEWVLHPVIR